MSTKTSKSNIYLFTSISCMIALVCTALLLIPPLVAFLYGTNYSLGLRFQHPGLTLTFGLIIVVNYFALSILLLKRKTSALWIMYLVFAITFFCVFAEPIVNRLLYIIEDEYYAYTITHLFTNEISFRTFEVIFRELIYLFVNALSVSAPLWCSFAFISLSMITHSRKNNSKNTRKMFILPLVFFTVSTIIILLKMLIYTIILLAEGSYLTEILPYVVAGMASISIMACLIFNTITINRVTRLNNNNLRDEELLRNEEIYHSTES